MTYLIIIALVVGVLVNHAVWLLLSRRSTTLRMGVAVPAVVLIYLGVLWMLGTILSHGGISEGSLGDWGLLILFAAAISFAYQFALGRMKSGT